MGAGAAGASEQRLPVRRRFEVFEMHMVIYSLVEASTEDEALSTGRRCSTAWSARTHTLAPSSTTT